MPDIQLPNTQTIADLWTAVRAGRVSYTTFTGLQAALARPLGSMAEVQGDAGTHEDPVSNAIVNNQGVYRRVVEGWQRVGDLSTDIQNSVLAAKTAAEAARDDTIAAANQVPDRGTSITKNATLAQSNAFKAYDGSQSAQPLYPAVAADSRTSSGKMLFPAGLYPVEQLLVPDNNADDNRGRVYRIEGVGSGEPFAAASYGTVLLGTDATKAVIKSRQQNGFNPISSTGDFNMSSFRVEHTSNADIPVLDIGTMYGPVEMYQVHLRQHGVGDGAKIDYMGTGAFSLSYILGASWAEGGNPVRTGIGIKLGAPTDIGLATFQKITSRGWNIGYRLGDVGTANISTHLIDCESSANTTGVKIAASAKATQTTNLFVEGTTYPVVDEGRASTHVGAFMELGLLKGMQLNGPQQTVVGAYVGGASTGFTAFEIQAGAVAGGASLLGCGIRWAGAGATDIIGIDIQAEASPYLDIIGTRFDPGVWTGTNVQKIIDRTRSYEHGNDVQYGSGVVGLMQREVGDGKVIPALARGSINLHVDGDVLVDADVAGYILTIGAASVQRVDFTASTYVNRLKAPNLPDKTGSLYFTNGNVQLEDSVYLKGVPQLLQVPAGKAVWVDYQVMPGNAAAVHIKGVRLDDPRFTVAQLATLKGHFSQPIIATDGRKAGEGAGAGTGVPVWWDGANWKTFYDNTTVAA